MNVLPLLFTRARPNNEASVVDCFSASMLLGDYIAESESNSEGGNLSYIGPPEHQRQEQNWLFWPLWALCLYILNV